MGQKLRRSRSTGRVPALILVLLVVGTMTGCARGKSVNPLLPTPTSEVGSPESTPSLSVARKVCQDGEMRIGDVPAIDAVWQSQMEAPGVDALDWHSDAQLVQLRVSCALFGSGFRMQPSYFSAQAQAILAEDTRESRPVNLDPEQVETLPMDSISFIQIYDALIQADYTDDLVLDPSTGIDIRINSQQAPFGPSGVPEGVLVAHVSIDRSGQIKDLFIDLQSGKIYAFESPA